MVVSLHILYVRYINVNFWIPSVLNLYQLINPDYIYATRKRFLSVCKHDFFLGFSVTIYEREYMYEYICPLLAVFVKIIEPLE
jgi:hypothetical protein